MKIKRIMIAAPKSGSGKTTVTCALLHALIKSGRQPVSYKCGPDYIDPMFHQRVLGVPAKNLDTFFTGEEQTREIFLRNLGEKDFAVMEGVMGLYDGLGGIREEGSSYHLAKVTKTPILLVVDAKGMGRSVVSLLAGFLAYDKENLIRGVLLNRISKGYYEIIKPLIESELAIPVVGFMPDKDALRIGSRHLGLILPEELRDIRERLQTASEEFEKTVSVEHMIQIAERAEEINAVSAFRTETAGWKTGMPACCGGEDRDARKESPVIAVAKDEAFCFYYEDNLRLLQENGAVIQYFSPLWDEELPAGCNALLFGGGYPELYADRLSANEKMRRAVRDASEAGMPIVAECGGFLYLHAAMRDQEGITHDMAGVLPAECYDTGKSVRFGYIEMQEKAGYFLPKGTKIKGHEFHYYDSTDNGTDCVARKPVTGKEYPCMIVDETHWMGFAHLYYPSNPAFARAFVEKAAQYKEGSRLSKNGKFLSIF